MMLFFLGLSPPPTRCLSRALGASVALHTAALLAIVTLYPRVDVSVSPPSQRQASAPLFVVLQAPLATSRAPRPLTADTALRPDPEPARELVVDPAPETGKAESDIVLAAPSSPAADRIGESAGPVDTPPDDQFDRQSPLSARSPNMLAMAAGGGFDEARARGGGTTHALHEGDAFNEMTPRRPTGSGGGTGIESGQGTGADGGYERRASPILTTPPRILQKLRPSYTEDAKARRVAGVVELAVVFLASGHVRIVSVTKGLDAELDRRAEDAVRAIVFEPARRKGQKVDFPARVFVSFNLTSVGVEVPDA